MRLSAAERALFQRISRMGGKARAKKLTQEQRTSIARRAATIRWERERTAAALAARRGGPA